MVGILVLLAWLAADWVALIPQVDQSIAKVEIDKAGRKGICTAVPFNREADGMMAAFTAAHCVDHQPSERIDLTVSDRTAYVVDYNKIIDIAIVRYRPRSGEVPIPIAKELPKPGEEVMIVGYPFGVERVGRQFGHVSQHNKETKTTWLDVNLIFGDSGGAAVNAAGELVGVNSAIVSEGPAHVGMVVTVEQLQDYVDYYRSRYVKK